jgi:hypothetical protein
MNPYRHTCIVSLCLVVLVVFGSAALGQQAATLVELNKLPYFYGREYFVLRSGRTQMIVQADRADLGPAFTYLLFDAQDARQSAAKQRALNFTAETGFASSALEVVLGGYPFTALGHRTETHWVSLDGVPAVEAVWWAGGVRVTERISALGSLGTFHRSIRLEGAHLVGEESVRLRLSLPAGDLHRAGSMLFYKSASFLCALGVIGDIPTVIQEAGGVIEAGPIPVAPGAAVTVSSVLLTQIPAGGENDFANRIGGFQPSTLVNEIDATRRNWKRSSVVETQDKTVRDIFDKARFGLPGMVADDGIMDAGIFEYGAQWVRDTSNTALGLIHAGQFEIARRTLERVLDTMVSSEGVTMIAGSFVSPDQEQFDQMGELLHVLKAYRDWTGDDSLVRGHRQLLLALIERPLESRFRDDSGMVHNRREFWERAFGDAYELAYQTWVIQGLRDAAELATALDAAGRGQQWREEASRMLDAMLAHPSLSLVVDGRLVKRRNVSGEIADLLEEARGYQPDVPAKTEKHHRLLPDATQALPIAFRLVDPRSPLSMKTLDELESLWNTRWTDGGYDRYHTSVQPDQPGPWPFATCFILRAQHEAGLFDRSRRSLEWLNSVQGGRAGAWFEEIPSVRSNIKGCGLVPWTSGEIALFVVRHYLGVQFEGDRLVIKPALYPGSPPVKADLRFRQARLQIEVPDAGPIINAKVNGVEVRPAADGALHLPADLSSGLIQINPPAK